MFFHTAVFSLRGININPIMTPPHTSSYYNCMASSALCLDCPTGILIARRQHTTVWAIPRKWFPFIICLHLSLSSFRNFHFMTILSSSQLSLSEHILPLCGIRQTAWSQALNDVLRYTLDF